MGSDWRSLRYVLGLEDEHDVVFWGRGECVKGMRVWMWGYVVYYDTNILLIVD